MGPVGPTEKENEVKKYKSAVSGTGTLPILNGKDPDSYQTVGSGSASDGKAESGSVSD